ncbi:MAG: hypothetical protein ACRCTJ_07250 [Brevinema sp.]
MSDTKKTKYKTAKLEVEDKLLFLQEKTKHLLQELKQERNVNNLYTLLAITIYHSSIIELYFEQNQIYYSFYERNNEPILDKIRKEFVGMSTLTREFFGRKIPQTLHEISIPLAEAQKITPKRLLNLFNKIILLWDKLKKHYGINSRYINTLADIYGDICFFILNIVDFKYYLIKVRNINDSEYHEIKNLLDFIGNFLIKVTENYKEAYNMVNSKNFVLHSLEILAFSEKFFRATNDKRLSDLGRKKEMWERNLK